MNTFRCILVPGAHQVPVDLLRHEGNHGRRRLAYGNQGSVQRHIGIDLILLHALGPETLPAPAHIPVAHLFHKILQGLCRLRDPVFIQIPVHLSHHRVQPGKQPFIHHRKLLVFQRIFRCVKAIDIGVQHKESIGVPQFVQELVLSLQHRPAGKTLGQPGCGAGVKIPADGICPILAQGLERIHHIPLGLAHFLAILVRHKSQDDHIFIRRLVEQKRGFRQQGIKPSPGLVNRLGDKLGGELLFKLVLVFKRIVVLGKRHGTGVKPAVDDFRHALHGLAAFGAGERHFVNIRSVQLCLLHCPVSAQHAQLFPASHTFHMPASAFPDI